MKIMKKGCAVRTLGQIFSDKVLERKHTEFLNIFSKFYLEMGLLPVQTFY